MSIAGTFLFIICGAVALVSALIVITQQNPIRAAFSLLLHIIALAGLFLGLQGHLLAIIQLIVYAGAVVVLFIFTIMYIGPIPPIQDKPKLSIASAFSVLAMVLVTGTIANILMGFSPQITKNPECLEGIAECSQFGGVEAFSATLFRDGVVPFELVSILLTVAIVGAIMVARGRNDSKYQTQSTNRKGFSSNAKPSSEN